MMVTDLKDSEMYVEVHIIVIVDEIILQLDPKIPYWSQAAKVGKMELHSIYFSLSEQIALIDKCAIVHIF